METMLNGQTDRWINGLMIQVINKEKYIIHVLIMLLYVLNNDYNLSIIIGVEVVNAVLHFVMLLLMKRLLDLLLDKLYQDFDEFLASGLLGKNI